MFLKVSCFPQTIIVWSLGQTVIIDAKKNFLCSSEFFSASLGHLYFQYLSSCDEIIVIKDGMIAERGEHQALMQQNGEYSSLINRYYTQEDVEETTDG